MLHLETSRRYSIDVDIVCPPGTDIREFLGQYVDEYGFTKAKEIERNSRTGVPNKSPIRKLPLVRHAVLRARELQYQRLDCWYLRPSIRYTPLPWMKLGLSYDYLKLPNTYGHRAVAETTGTLKEGLLTASLRFRYLHTWKPQLRTEDNELRTRLLISYAIPQAKITPYLATESFTWGMDWRRTRNYIGSDASMM